MSSLTVHSLHAGLASVRGSGLLLLHSSLHFLVGDNVIVSCDDVKHMNQMVMYSKIVTVRDKQLLESKILEEEWVKEQKRLDLMMEIERLKSLQAAEDRDTK